MPTARLLRIAVQVTAHVAAALLIAGSAGAEQRPRVVAVFDIENAGAPLTADELASLVEYFSSKLGEDGRLSIVPRSEIQRRLRSAKRDSYKSCYDQQCQIEVGREVAAQLAVATRISRIGGRCVVTAALHDLKTAASARTATAEARCSADDLLEAVKEIAGKLRGDAQRAAPATAPATAQPVQPKVIRVIERTQVVERKSVLTAVVLSFLPGGGMYYVGKWGWGILYTATVVGGMVMFVTGFGADSAAETPLVAVGLTMFYGGTIGCAIHAGVSAHRWRPPGEKRSQQQTARAFTLPLLRLTF